MDNKRATVTVTLTLQELETLVCQGRAPVWLEHRWLCHPERECEDGCSVRADSDRVRLYQTFQFGGGTS